MASRRTGQTDPIAVLRHRIDALDRKIMALLNQRADCAIALGHLKQQRNIPVYQPEREHEVLANVQRTNTGPLEDVALRRLFERIIDESRRIERLLTATPPRADERAIAHETGDGETD